MVGIWELDDWDGSDHSLVRVVDSTQTVEIVWFMSHICVASGNLESGHIVRQRCECDQPPIKTLGIESLKEQPW